MQKKGQTNEKENIRERGEEGVALAHTSKAYEQRNIIFKSKHLDYVVNYFLFYLFSGIKYFVFCINSKHHSLNVPQSVRCELRCFNRNALELLFVLVRIRFRTYVVGVNCR